MRKPPFGGAEYEYVRKGVFEPAEVVALLRWEMQRTLAEGYAGLRVTSEMTWVLRGVPGSERLIEYKAGLNEFFPGSQCLAMCQYDRRRFDPTLLLDVLRTHPVAVTDAQVHASSHYIPPDTFVASDFAAVALHRWQEKLAQGEPSVLTLVIVASGRQVSLAKGDEFLLGRLDATRGIFPDVDLTPDGGLDGGVSRRHARVFERGGQILIEDLGSANGTFLNGQRLASYLPYPLQGGDRIQLGRFELRVQ